MKNRIDEINELRKQLDDEIKMIQETCTHDEYHIGIYSWRIGSYNLNRICEKCYTVRLGTPSKEEEDNYYAEMNELKRIHEETGAPYSQGKGTTIFKRTFSLEELELSYTPQPIKVHATKFNRENVVNIPPSKPFI